MLSLYRFTVVSSIVLCLGVWVVVQQQLRVLFPLQQATFGARTEEIPKPFRLHFRV